MGEIRSLLAQGKSSAEVIALGFNPSTVNKTQSQFRRLNEKTEQPQQLETPGERATEHLSLREALAHTLDRISELETKAGSADEWEKKYHDVESRLDHAVEAMGQEVQDWQEKFVAEEKARKGAEALAAQHGAEAGQLKEENRLLRQKVSSLPNHLAQEVWKMVQPLNAELKVFRSLHTG